MSTVIVVLAHHDYEDEIVTNIHGVYLNEDLFRKEATELQYSHDTLNDVYFSVINGRDVEFEIVLQHVKGST